MARKINEEEYAIKRNEILDVVQSLIYTNGYEQITIQDILNSLKISKGAFYHYFDSKQALLTALLDRILEQMQELLTPIVENPEMQAVEKLQHIFNAVGSWKTARRAFLMSLLQVWYHDDNAIVRQKMRIAVGSPVSSLLTTVIYQGIAEGTLRPVHPDQVARVVFSLLQDLGDTVAMRLLSFDPETDDLQTVEDIVTTYTHTIETALGAPPGSLPLFRSDLLRAWFLPGAETAEGITGTS